MTVSTLLLCGSHAGRVVPHQSVVCEPNSPAACLNPSYSFAWGPGVMQNEQEDAYDFPLDGLTPQQHADRASCAAYEARRRAKWQVFADRQELPTGVVLKRYCRKVRGYSEQGKNKLQQRCHGGSPSIVVRLLSSTAVKELGNFAVNFAADSSHTLVV